MSTLSVGLRACGCAPPCRLYLEVFCEDGEMATLGAKVILRPGLTLERAMWELVAQLRDNAWDAGLSIDSELMALMDLVEGRPFPEAKPSKDHEVLGDGDQLLEEWWSCVGHERGRPSRS